MAVDVRQLRALVAVVNEGTFTDAAIALGTSQASISRAVAELENDLGARLLLRTNHGAHPNVLGRRVTEHARRVLGEIDLIEGVGEQTGADLRVGFAWSVFGRLTTAIQRQWQTDHGSVAFIQSSTPTAGLLEGEVDLAVLRRPLRDQRFDTSLVGTEARYAAIDAGDPLARRRHHLNRAVAHRYRTHTPTRGPRHRGMAHRGSHRRSRRYQLRSHRPPIPPARDPLPATDRRTTDRGLAGLVEREPTPRSSSLPPPRL